MQKKLHLNFKKSTIYSLILLLVSVTICEAQTLRRVGMETDEYIELEAENFDEQTETSKRKWYLVAKNRTPKIKKDPDPNHSKGASGYSYLELLPDTLYDGNEKKSEGKNYSKTPGKVAILSYNVNFKTSGRFYVWVRGLSTGPEDNSIHVGIDGNWPDSGQKLYICEGERNRWSWTSHQFTGSEKCGGNKRIFLDIKKPGLHKIMFSMREDGFEFDKFALTRKMTKKLIDDELVTFNE